MSNTETQRAYYSWTWEDLKKAVIRRRAAVKHLNGALIYWNGYFFRVLKLSGMLDGETRTATVRSIEIGSGESTHQPIPLPSGTPLSEAADLVASFMRGEVE